MKVWVGFGSEHSANLRMIGHFDTPEDAESARRRLQELCDLVVEKFDHERFAENPWAWFLDSELRKSLDDLGLYGFTPQDLESLVGDHRIDRQGSDIHIRTDESAVSGLIKFMIDRPVRVEVYSAHHFPAEDSSRP